MELREFALERYFARWEFAVQHVLCASDVQPWRLDELLALACDDLRAEWQRLPLGYREAAGDPRLRAEIARLYETTSADDVLVFNGAEEAIFIAANALVQPRDHAVVIWPAYQALHEVARGVGARISLVRLQESEGWRLDVDTVRAACRPNTRLIVVNFPNSPTGALPDRETFEALVALAHERGAWLLSDEVYRGLEFDPAHRLPAAVDRYERALSLGVMSKSYALPGLRIGWIATHDAGIRARLASLKDYTTICAAAPSELLALIALRAGPEVLERSRRIIGENLVRLDRFMADHATVLRWIPPRAGSIAFPCLVADEPVERMTDALVETEGVMLLPGRVFGDHANHFRIGFGRTDLAEGLDRFGRFLEKRYGR